MQLSMLSCVALQQCQGGQCTGRELSVQGQSQHQLMTLQPGLQYVTDFSTYLPRAFCSQPEQLDDQGHFLKRNRLLHGKHLCLLQLQLALCGQDPETALNSALASVNFYLQQQQLYFEFREAQLQKKINKVQEACKKKLQEVHTGYTAVSSKSPHCMPIQVSASNDRTQLCAYTAATAFGFLVVAVCAQCFI